MMIALHKNATTTPAVRAQIQQSSASEYELAQQYSISRTTVQRWKHRDSVEDRSHTPHRLQTTLNAGQEELVVYLRKQLRLPLDDLLAVVREFVHPTMGRSSLHRLLVRRGVDQLPKPSPESSPAKPFKAYEPGYVHIDVKYLPQMADEPSRGYAFVAIDRATRWVFISIKRRKTAAAARSFLKEVAKAAPFVISTILTDNGKEFTDRLFGSRAKDASGEHEFDLLCESLGIEHRLTKPRTPRTNGMVERFNGRLEQVLQTHRFNSAEDLSKTLHRYVWLYNQHLPQKALNHQTPLTALKRWQESHPHLFKKKVVNHPGPDKTVRDGDQNKTDQEEHARSAQLKEDKFKPATTRRAVPACAAGRRNHEPHLVSGSMVSAIRRRAVASSPSGPTSMERSNPTTPGKPAAAPDRVGCGGGSTPGRPADCIRRERRYPVIHPPVKGCGSL
jgi:transposase InsO family protein